MAHGLIEDERNVKTAEDEWDNSGITFAPSSNTRKLVQALLSQVDRIDDDIQDIRDSRHIDTASGEDLDNIGKLVQIPRKEGESDDKYRARLKVAFRVGSIGTTFDEFAEFSASLLETDIQNIEFQFNLDGNPATVEVAANQDVYDNSKLSQSEVAEYLGRAVPAGHEVNALTQGGFRLKSDGETDTASKGLTSDSTSDGGGLSSDVV